MDISRLKTLSGIKEDEYDDRQADSDEYGESEFKKIPMDLWYDIVRALESARYCDHDEVAEVMRRIESLQS